MAEVNNVGNIVNQGIIKYQKDKVESLEQKALQNRKDQLTDESKNIGTKVEEADNGNTAAKIDYAAMAAVQSDFKADQIKEKVVYKEVNTPTGSAEQGAYNKDEKVRDPINVNINKIGLAAERKIYQTEQGEIEDETNVGINTIGLDKEKIIAQSEQPREMDDTNMKITDRTTIGKKVDVII